MRRLDRAVFRGSLIAAAVMLSVAVHDAAKAQDKSPAKSEPGQPALDYRPEAIYPAQRWTSQTARWWYHVSQGTVFMPAEWFVSLEQASGTALFAAADHLARLGFLPDPQGSANPLGLPVGFATRKLDFPDNDNLQHYQFWKGEWVGLTCAACHTGQLNYKGQRIRIDGGPAHLDIEAFGEELGAALAATAASEPKFQRFARRVNERGVAIDPAELRQQLALFLRDSALRNSLFEAGSAAASQEATRSGPGRLDAVHRGGNLLLAGPLGEVRNYVPTTAPVRFPMLWDTPYFDWVLYNASIRQPMARNVIEDLGVGAPIDPKTFLSGEVRHGVLMDEIVRIQRALARLESPKWPEGVLGKIDDAKADRGRVVFQQSCAGCHQPINRRTHAPASGTAPGAAGSGVAASDTITIKTVPLEEIGTDPRQARNFASRMINLEKVGGPSEIPYMKAAETVAGRIVEQWAQRSPENARAAEEINTGRPNEFRGPQAYRARPLNGLWAAPPYLHNGSVPSLYELLLPPSRRSRVFYVGSWEFDPERVGLVVGSPFPGAFMFDTRLPGNSNAGHEYGTDLNDADRTALIEYLKTL